MQRKIYKLHNPKHFLPYQSQHINKSSVDGKEAAATRVQFSLLTHRKRQRYMKVQEESLNNIVVIHQGNQDNPNKHKVVIDMKLEGGKEVFKLFFFTFSISFHLKNFYSQIFLFFSNLFNSSLPNRKFEISTMRIFSIISSNIFCHHLFLFGHQTDIASLVTQQSDYYYLHVQIILEKFPSHLFHKPKSCNIHSTF